MSTSPMTTRRLELHEILCGILGSRNVYFQPPENLKMKFPCIIYEHEGNDVKPADDTKYSKIRKYQVTIIDKDPDTEIPERLDNLRFASFDRRFTADNMNNIVYTVYY